MKKKIIIVFFTINSKKNALCYIEKLNKNNFFSIALN